MDVVANSKVNTTELYFLVAKFLEAGPCQGAAKVLKEELGQHQLLPSRKNWLGEERQLSYKEASDANNHIESNHLELICSKLLNLLEQNGYQKASGLHSLLGTGVSANIQSKYNSDQTAHRLQGASSRQHHRELSIGYREQPVTNIYHAIRARQVSPTVSPRDAFIGPQRYTALKKHCVVLGHLAPVFCVLFDLTGRCIITGADDELLKVWSSQSGQLLATLRGHSAEVTDISLSCDNTMIASGSIDKSVRVWCSQTSAPIAVLSGHQSQVTSVQFSHSPIEEFRYLASTGKDGFLCFWQWLPDSSTFSSSPVKFMEKNRMGDQTLCSAFSPGGKYFVTGGTDCIIRVYICIPGPPTLQAELGGHTDRIMTVQFGHTGQGLFATGSCDGSALIWRFKEEGWTSTTLKLSREENIKVNLDNSQSGKFQVQVTMVGWEKTDTFLMTAFSPDCCIRIWNSKDGELVNKLSGHTGEVFVLESHPSDSRILLSAGHDGLVILWDMLAGVQLKTLNLEEEDGAITCIFDCKFSPDGLTCVAADSSGYLTVMGFGSSEPYKKHPKEQFFHTDYRPLMRDRNHYVVDENSQLPPHLLPPPYLVDIDGHAHPAPYQEAILKLVRPVERGRLDRSVEEEEDYDEYMKKHLARVKQHSFRFGRARWTSSTNSNPRDVRTEDNETRNLPPPDHSEGLVRNAEDERRREASSLVEDETSGNGEPSSMEVDDPGEGTSSQLENAVSKYGTPSGKMLPSTGGGVLPSTTSGEMLPATSDEVLPSTSGEALPCASDEVLPSTSGEALPCASDEVLPSTSDGTINSAVSPSAVHHSMEHNYASSSREPQKVANADDDRKPEGSSFLSPVQKTTVENFTDTQEHRLPTHNDDHGINIASARVHGESSHTPSGEQNRIQTRSSLQIQHTVSSDGRQASNEDGPPVLRGEPSVQREEQVNIVDVDESSQDGQNMMSSLIYSLGLTEVETKRCIAMWHNRTIIPQLDVAHLSSEVARRRQLYEEENENYEHQTTARSISQLARSSPTPLESTTKARSLRSGRTLPDPSALERRESLESEPLASESSASEMDVDEMYNEFESTDSSYISDWTTEAGIKFITPTRKRTKRRHKRSEMDSDNISSDDDHQYNDDDNDGLDDAGPSKRAERRRERAERRAAAGEESSSQIKPRRRPPIKPQLTPYLPSDWIKQTKPHLSPYLPQVKDIVVYCWQGHECYINAVRREKVYPCKNLKLPWQKYTLLPQEFCQVTNVRYIAGTPTLCSLTLALLTPTNSQQHPDGENGEQKERITFTLKYHDMDGVLDFLVLSSLYKASTHTTWSEGDRFRSLIDESYWYGKILRIEPFSEYYPNSYWQCFHILWDDGATDQLSPWDMEPLPSVDENGEEDITQDRTSRLLASTTESLVESWGGENEQERILRGLDEVLKLDEAFMFRQPVDFEDVPTYCKVIAFPTDLSTIRERLANNFYRSKLALLWEVALILRNTVTFNEEDSLIVEHARILVHTLWKFINDSTIADPLTCYEPTPSGEVEPDVEVVASELSFVPVEDIVPPSDSITSSPVKSSALKQVPTSSGCCVQLTRHSSSSMEEQTFAQVTTIPWVGEAEQLLSQIKGNDNAVPFLQPVDVEEYKDYLFVVHQPMDLSTVSTKLHSCEYSCPNDFISDIRLIFKNAKTYNRKGSEVYKMTLELENLFEVQVLGFLKSCQGDTTTPLYGTRRTLNRLASINTTFPSVSGSTTSSIASNRSSVSSFNDGDIIGGGGGGGGGGSSAVKSEYCKHLRSASTRGHYNGIHYSSGEEEGVYRESVSVDGSLSSIGEDGSRVNSTRRTTRSMVKVTENIKSREESEEMGGSVSEESFGMTLRRRLRKRPLPSHGSEAEESGSPEDSEEEEEEELQEEEEADDEYGTNLNRKRQNKRTSTTRSGRVLRKRRKFLMDSDEEDRETEVVSSTLTTSRSGRVVKPVIRGDY